MEVPPQVETALDGDTVIERVDLGAEEALYLTSAETLHYQGEGLLSDAGVDRYPHEDVTMVSVTTGRRKASIELAYAVGEDRELSVPGHALQDVLEPLLAGILAHSGVLASDETVRAVYRFSELTLILTSEQLLKHVGAAVWDPDYETIAWGDVTDLDIEEGEVAAQLVVETAARRQRTKIPRDEAVAVHRDVEAALCSYHGVSDYSEFESLVADAEGRPEPESANTEEELTEIGLEPLGAGTPNRDLDRPASAATDHTESGESGETRSHAQPTDAPPSEGVSRSKIVTELEELETALARHTERLEEYRQRIADLREDLNRDQ